ncbi:MAG: hypothetical protein U5Q16_02025 [Gammaproteobacteria bacterium]|nr:hypothetical protein [Gammaproteobacteria bacterium]
MPWPFMNAMCRTAAARRLVLISSLLCLPAGAGAQEAEALSDLSDKAEIDEHRSFDPDPDLQRVPGGSLIVNAFIMDGPVRVDIHDRHSDEVILHREADSMFPFEVSRQDLAVEPEDVLVRIYVKGELTHTLKLER